MPRGDRTGPGGMGPMTGRGLGYCAGDDMPGYMNPAPGRGFGGGWGAGWRWRHWRHGAGLPGWAGFGYGPVAPVPPVYAAPTREQELDALKRQAEFFKSQMDAVNKRLSELEEE